MAEFQIHTVVKGNTLWGLAKKNHTTVDEIIKLNPQLKDRPNLIRIGEKIKLPPKSADDVDMNVKGMSIEKTGAGNSEQNAAKTQRTTGTKRTQQLVDPTANKVKTPTPGKDWSEDLILDDAAFDNSVSNNLAQKRVEYIIGKYNSNPVFGKFEYAKKIVGIANTVGIDPLDLAAIVKRESTFLSNEEIYKRYGKKGGPTGITNSPPNDMYQEHRFQLYDSKMAALKKQYGSLKNIFAAKDKNPEMNLGDFGEMLYKYGSAAKLKEACTKDYDVNLKVGAYYYKRVLKECNGNVKSAFNRYNIGTAGYGRDALSIVNNAKNTIVG